MTSLLSHPPSRPTTQGSLLQIDQTITDTIHSSLDSTTPNSYIININLSSINSRNYHKDKIKQQYLEHFRNQLGIRSKSRVLPGSQDYLYKLTTKEIDNLITMERNRHVATEIQVEFGVGRDGQGSGRNRTRQQKQRPKRQPGSERDSRERTHHRIYRPSFLSRLNKIVKKTNFLNKSDNLVTYHYKQPDQKKNPRYISGDTLPESQYFQHDNLDNFGLVGKGVRDKRAMSEKKGRERPFEEKKGGKADTWFYGMSRSLIAKTEEREEPVFRGMNLERKMEMNPRMRTSYN